MATIVDGKKRIPFMRGMLVHHLIQRGFDHDEAYGIADEVRTEVRRRKEVERGQILDLNRGSAQTRPSGPPSRQSPVLGTRADDDHR